MLGQLYDLVYYIGAVSGLDGIWADAVAEYNRRAKPTYDRELTQAEQLDALIDAYYYCCDQIVRGWAWVGEPASDLDEATVAIARSTVQMVEEFVHGAFGREVKTEKLAGLHFVLTMILSEFLEYENVHPSQADEVMRLQISVDADRKNAGANLWTVLCAIYKTIESRWPGKFWPAFTIVHDANLSKGVATETGRVYTTKTVAGALKIMKPAGWREPNLDVLFAAENATERPPRDIPSVLKAD